MTDTTAPAPATATSAATTAEAIAGAPAGAPAGAIAVGMSMADFLARSVKEGPFELIDGEVVPKMLTGWGQSKFAKRLFVALLTQEQKGIGQVFPETTYVLMYSPEWVKGSRVPDLLFVRSERLAEYESGNPTTDSMPLLPDFALNLAELFA